ncbi:MAG: tRNA pseudouridine(38-40) synthase TruA [Puniceicoccales bacterium]|jgi:tRNA pseudouridine38-40 synthase|nr:tRNA pseudouridine(38-40) synthase TruA [Puniceicoccales bacterium]
MRWRCECQYDGTDFQGWQSQPHGNTLQDYIEGRLAVIFGKKVRIHGSGRTDCGVHARGQVFHFDGEWHHDTEKLRRALHSGLPSGIQITEIHEVDNYFHARFSVKKKRYTYQIYLGHASPFEKRYKWSIGHRTIDLPQMNALAHCLLGEHDFSAFGAFGGDHKDTHPRKTLYQLTFLQDGCDVILATEGNGYLYKMVRTLTATLLEVGLGKIDGNYVLDCFQKGIRREKITTAPPHGLFLDKVFY